jgi:hypothetical protein
MSFSTKLAELSPSLQMTRQIDHFWHNGPSHFPGTHLNGFFIIQGKADLRVAVLLLAPDGQDCCDVGML